MKLGTSQSATSLEGLTALVTGSSSGIGRATAEMLAAAGANMVIHYHSNQAAGAEAVQAIRAAGGNAQLQHADLARPEQAQRLVDQTVQHFGGLDLLVNNAGSVVARAKIEDCSLELWQQAHNVNLTSAFVVTQRAIPHLRKSGRGAIVNVLSLSVQTGGANGAGAYAAAKGGLQVFTRTLAKELAPQVRTNAVMREIRTQARLDHPNLVRAYDAGCDGKVHYLVTEYVPGMSQAASSADWS